MTTGTLYALCGLGLFGIGLTGMIVRRHLMQKIIATNVISSGVFLVLVAMADRTPGGPPDPVPHAMVLTGLVVAISATALALALLRRFYRETGRCQLPESAGGGQAAGGPAGGKDHGAGNDHGGGGKGDGCRTW